METATRTNLEAAQVTKIKQALDGGNNKKAVECSLGHVGTKKQRVTQAGTEQRRHPGKRHQQENKTDICNQTQPTGKSGSVY